MTMNTEVTFDCRSCHKKTKKYNDWRKHLLTEFHQEKARLSVKFMSPKTKKSTAVVFGILNIKVKDVLKYFGDLSVVSEFIFWKERSPGFCILRFLNSQLRNKIVSGEHEIEGTKLSLKSLNEMDAVEWISICPYAAVLKIEVDSENEEGSKEDPFAESSDDEDKSNIIMIEELTPPNPIPKKEEIVDDDSESESLSITSSAALSSNAITSEKSSQENEEENTAGNPFEFSMISSTELSQDRQEKEALLEDIERLSNISEDDENEVVVPAVVPPIVSAPLPPQSSKIKDFTIQLDLKKEFLGKLVGTELKINQNVVELFERFNSLVWQGIFGVKLSEFPENSKTINTVEHKGMKPLVSPFKGEVFNHTKLKWATKNYSKRPTKSKKTNETLRSLRIQFAKLLAHLDNSKDTGPIIDAPSDSSSSSSLKHFSFDCQVTGCINKVVNSSQAVIDLKFTNIRYRHKTDKSKNVFQKNIQYMYVRLWTDYVLRSVGHQNAADSNY